MNYLLILIPVVSILFSCNDKMVPLSNLELISDYNIAVPEPSGLAVNISGNVLYTVSDNTNKVYKISTTGLVLQTFNYVGNDLEGICSFGPSKFLLAEERKKQIIELDIFSGNIINHQLDYDNNAPNSGLEGITYNSKNQAIYVINEKQPGIMFKLDKNFAIKERYDLNFANDYSGIFYEEIDDLLWIVSDESSSIYKCTLEGKMIESYIINVNKPEGIVVRNNKIYIISDTDEKLYVYKKP